METQSCQGNHCQNGDEWVQALGPGLRIQAFYTLYIFPLEGPHCTFPRSSGPFSQGHNAWGPLEGGTLALWLGNRWVPLIPWSEKDAVHTQLRERRGECLPNNPSDLKGLCSQLWPCPRLCDPEPPTVFKPRPWDWILHPHLPPMRLGVLIYELGPDRWLFKNSCSDRTPPKMNTNFSVASGLWKLVSDSATRCSRQWQSFQ